MSDQTTDEPSFYHETHRLLDIPSRSGLCRFQFRPGSTGPIGSDTSPGLGIYHLAERGTVEAALKFLPKQGESMISQGGVIGRKDALLLYRLLGQFLSEAGMLPEDEDETPRKRP